jgi:hypothetical protein
MRTTIIYHLRRGLEKMGILFEKRTEPVSESKVMAEAILELDEKGQLSPQTKNLLRGIE